ncbi:antitoxin Xre/MbcA/ParS toxin-binding domain-containing protein [Halopseudomonas yangmingensis]|uniref:Putative toxin-antitoxin system antitoxin component, TIGR02293 family n=1 Tax=Halopseudomonas yangmingensis TaxID=1720063 RepID=A0A1I4SLM4_9GAMM|nr:antitoxin Xre/MbcA/ParS toxin-binding domain-containing protein [Halopseudomonas yangmingensis]SFM65332.1 putative toxin-antitoxin system antitoxin component, TIGR02293 family [Halopseudomonas yangmingensis]
MDNLHEKLALPKGHYSLHVAVLSGLPVSLISDLASILGRSPAQVAEWVAEFSGNTVMTLRAGETFCRLVEILDALLELHDENHEAALHWLTTPNMVLSNERPIELLTTEAGARAVRQAICAIEYGLPV